MINFKNAPLLILVLTGIISLLNTEPVFSQKSMVAEKTKWTDNFNLSGCQFVTTGRNDYFILEPGYKLVLEGTEDGDTVSVEIIVLDEVKMIGDIDTRVVIEKESVNRRIKELSRNYYAFCPQNGSIFYFGEDVDIYEDGEIVGHGGA
jgi:hypothetical protein